MMSYPENYEFEASGALGLETDLAFQRYRVLASIGRGGMSEVFLAGLEQDGSIQRLAVMKRLNAELCSDPVTVQMFLDEARIGLRLNHPNIAQTQDVGRFEGRLCILMDYLKGQPLHRIVHRIAEQSKVLPLELAVKLIVDVLDGLGSAHEACDYDGSPLGVVHRDISPHNLFVEYDGRVKVLDFGIAKAAIQEGATRTGLVKGKFAYMAPEQARAEPVDRRADIWSVGVVFWELLTGARLFKGPTEAAMLHATLRSPIPYPAAYRSDVPPILEQVVQRALERDKSRRYGSAPEMKEDLERWLEGQGRGFTASLAAFMTQAFGAERDEQQNFVRELLAQRVTSPTSSGTMARLVPPPVGGRTDASDLGEMARNRTQTNQLMQVLERKNRFATWMLVGLLALFVGLLTGVAVVLLQPPPLLRQEQASVSSPAPVELARNATEVEQTEPRAQQPLEHATAETPPREAPELALASPQLAHPIRQFPRPTKAQQGAAAGAEPAAPKASSAVAPPAEPGYLTLDTSPWSVVSVAGRVLGTTPLVRVALPPGNVLLSLSNPETGAHASYSVRIEAGKTLSRRIGLE